ncbi:hypothetical protein DASC09_008770 [Saccharomycopsis crataegensis]|uniref:Enoyl reductase (ER) domain-containing protein n=1 Tax=Saccharomycopsis crataegensis TaxID=43959 RepID=A0AAV5QFN0_9ASCO|nr:hypothetical protein DASC09_008770 [Saccharomycopsis crataegensis]
MSYPNYFEGLGVVEEQGWPQTNKVKYAPKKLGPNDIDIKINVCGVCGSDVHNSAGRWGERHFPMVPGHEVIGHIVKLGPQCSRGLKIGQRVGLGPVILSCENCESCKRGHYGSCPDLVVTYNGKYEDGNVSRGGFASHIRINENYAFEIPENITSEVAAPLLCAGITAFAPLYRNKVQKGSKIGIVGIGGVGHMGVLFGKYFGSKVVAFDVVEAKRAPVLQQLNADNFFNNSEEKQLDEAIKLYKGSLDVLLIASNHINGINWDKFISLMKFGGKIITIAEPPSNEALNIRPFSLIGCSFEASAIGSFEETKTMLDIVSKEQDLKVLVEKSPLSSENLANAFRKMDLGDTRFKIVMTDFDKFFK